MNKKGVTVWFTGLPCCGKTTIADKVAEKLKKEGYRVERLDGDIVRQGLTSDLGFSKEDRDENIKRVSFVAKLLTRNGVIVLATFVSPYRARRNKSREEIGNFVEVYTQCPVEVCAQRDVKGMYKKALRGEIKNFTGVDDPYEEPEHPELIINTDKETPEESVKKVLMTLKEFGYISEVPRIPAMLTKFEIYQDKSGEYRFRLKAANGEIIAQGEGYKSKSSCEKGIESIKTNAPKALIEDLTI